MAVNRQCGFLILLFLLFRCDLLFSQSKIPVLERTISINVSGEHVESVLDEIAKQGKFSFSYNPDLIDKKMSISLKVYNKTVREVVDMVLGREFRFKARGEHVILTKATVPPRSSSPPYFIISGYVTNGRDGGKVPEVSIYDKASLSSSISNQYGYYEIRIDRKGNRVQLNVNKEQFKDTLIYVNQSGNAVINVTIYPEEKAKVDIDSTGILEARIQQDQLSFMNFILSEEQMANAKNVKDTLYKKYQLSFLPFVGTNLKLGGNTVNEYSLNILGGYSLGTRKLELAGLVNIDRDSVKTVQAAGLINAVGGHVQGVQIGGLINANMKTTSGVQVAGLINFVRDTMRGFQAAGLINSNLKSVKGISAAGLINSTLGKTEGVQAAGLLNFSLQEVEGVQVAGLLNVVMKNVTGTQVSGFANYARKVTGSQLGFLNISDSCSGVPLGFLSFSYHGYHVIEISTDEIFPVNLSFRTGVRRFYNIFQSGMKISNLDFPLWHFGYGLGTSVSLGNKWWLNFDLTTQQLVKGETFEQMNLLSKFNVTVDKTIYRKFAVAFGPVLNFYTSDITAPYYNSVFDKIAPYTYLNESYSNNLNIKIWLGGKLAIRFL